MTLHHLRKHVFHLCMVRCMSETENCRTSKEYGMMGMDSAADNSVSHRCLGEGEELQL